MSSNPSSSTSPIAPVEAQAEEQKVNGSIDHDGVRALVEPLVRAHGLVVYDIEWTNGPQGRILRVSIEPELVGAANDAPATSQGGVTLDECVRVSRDLSTALDAAELIGPHYNLEVSSPGLDRPLRSVRDYMRQVGRLAKLKLTEPASDGQHVLRGEIVGVDEESEQVTMLVDGNRHAVSLDNVHHAKLVFELGAQKKKGQKKSRKRTGS